MPSIAELQDPEALETFVSEVVDGSERMLRERLGTPELPKVPLALNAEPLTEAEILSLLESSE